MKSLQYAGPKSCHATLRTQVQLAFKRTGDPNMGNFGDATVLRTFGQVPGNLDEL